MIATNVDVRDVLKSVLFSNRFGMFFSKISEILSEYFSSLSTKTFFINPHPFLYKASFVVSSFTITFSTSDLIVSIPAPLDNTGSISDLSHMYILNTYKFIKYKTKN